MVITCPYCKNKLEQLSLTIPPKRLTRILMKEFNCNNCGSKFRFNDYKSGKYIYTKKPIPLIYIALFFLLISLMCLISEATQEYVPYLLWISFLFSVISGFLHGIIIGSPIIYLKSSNNSLYKVLGYFFVLANIVPLLILSNMLYKGWANT